ncbi:hypothetical protein RLIN73S_02261 [Rhodanobacter lindaniclasticus]
MDRLIKALVMLRPQRRDVVEIAPLGLNMDQDFGWISANWRRHVFPKDWGVDRAGWMQRRYFELVVLFQIKDELKSGDLFIPGGERYDDYREELVDESTFQEELASYGEVSGIATEPATFVRTLREQLRTKCREVDARFPDNAHADIVDGRLILRKLPRTELSKAIALVDSLITERLPETSIVDVLVDATSSGRSGPALQATRRHRGARARFAPPCGDHVVLLWLQPRAHPDSAIGAPLQCASKPG